MLTIKAKDFAVELTGHNVIEKDLKGVGPIESEHIDNNSAVRKMLIDRGVNPELLPPAEDTNKVIRRLKSEEKKILEKLKGANPKNANRNTHSVKPFIVQVM